MKSSRNKNQESLQQFVMDTSTFIDDVKQKLLNNLTSRLDSFNNDLNQQFQLISNVRSLNIELEMFESIQDDNTEFEECFQKLKDQVKGKILKIKELEAATSEFKISGKLSLSFPISQMAQARPKPVIIQLSVDHSSIDKDKRSEWNKCKRNNNDGQSVGCPKCEGQFSDLLGLRFHLNRIHNTQHKLFCPECDFKTSLSFPLAKHLLLSHLILSGNNNNRYLCPYTGKSFKNKALLASHINFVLQYATKSTQKNQKKELQQTYPEVIHDEAEVFSNFELEIKNNK